MDNDSTHSTSSGQASSPLGQTPNQNPQPQVDPTVQATISQQPVDPMDNPPAGGQIPDVPTISVQPQPVQDPMNTMQQMATAPVQPTIQQSMPTDPLPQVPIQTSVQDQHQVSSAHLGPVTLEDIMEELQHIEDRLDEMDEKL